MSLPQSCALHLRARALRRGTCLRYGRMQSLRIRSLPAAKADLFLPRAKALFSSEAPALSPASAQTLPVTPSQALLPAAASASALRMPVRHNLRAAARMRLSDAAHCRQRPRMDAPHQGNPLRAGCA